MVLPVTTADNGLPTHTTCRRLPLTSQMQFPAVSSSCSGNASNISSTTTTTTTNSNILISHPSPRPSRTISPPSSSDLMLLGSLSPSFLQSVLAGSCWELRPLQQQQPQPCRGALSN
ncbi:hypothetical protein PoB_000203900 [Plakobranchus ocellatus]|uniref:Uncharacterized protein n=1 Tax=Plakobranchus ocellatus TaxID=259542 RepID=A0AAV3Y0L9_9GAST|nr:hypothetical protein PoB_000203900 [Plakobranchus ocellatus]